MKVCFALLGLVCVVAGSAVPAEDQVRMAISRATELNTLRRRLNDMVAREMDAAAPAARCPLAKFHRIRENTDKTNERRSLDLLDAIKMLREQGFTTADLHDESVRSLFERSLGCPSAPACDPDSPWRTADGSCNNLQHETWGMAGVPQIRLIGKNSYADQVKAPRVTGVNGGDLPNARTVSNQVSRGPRGPEIRSPSLTLHAFQMGQFLDHDIVATPISAVSDCCTENADPDECFPLRVTENNDSQFANGYCMNFARSAASACPSSTSAMVRQQVNEITSWIDASNVYGSSKTETDSLRSGGFMNVVNPGNRLPDNEDEIHCIPTFMKVVNPGNRLPDNEDESHCIPNKDLNQHCSDAGDIRVNVVPSLTAYHTGFMREHNRIARVLSDAISDPETLFQTTRKIVSGVMQKIVYSEFLPAFMSPKAMTKYGLSSTANYEYDASLDATVDNGFGIAYRFGHTWIPRNMSVFDRNLRPAIPLRTEDTYLRPDMTYLTPPTPGIDGLAWWLSAENSPETDRIVEEAARSLLFLSTNADGSQDSFDLVALNIQRGRDHGLPSYDDFRDWCNLPRYTSWNQGAIVDHNNDARARLQRVYDSPQDIDLFVGVITETPVAGGSLGPTGECILGEQFRRLKYGDRFWYQNPQFGFQGAQLAAIERYSMAKLQCVNFNFARIHAPNAFLSTNGLRNCADIADLDMEVFKPAPPTTQAPPTRPPATRPPGNTPRPPPPNGGRPRPRSETLDGMIEQLLRELEDLDSNMEED